MTTSVFEPAFAEPATSIRAANQAIARALWAFTIVSYLALATGTAMTRQPYGDEGELASPAYNLVHRGHLEVTQWEGARQSHKAYWMPPVFFLAQAAWESVAGFGVIQFRLGTVVWGLILLIAVAYVVQKLANDTLLTALAAFVLGTDYTYVQHAGIGRCEIMSAALALAASAVYLRLRDRSLPVAVFVSHALVTLSGLTHPVGGMMWMPALIALQIGLDGRRLRWRDHAIAALPYMIGGAAWGVYILQDPAEFKRQFFGISLSEHRFAGLADPLTAFRREAQRFLGYYGVRPNASWPVRLKALLPVGYVIGLIGAAFVPGARKQPLIRGAVLVLAVQLFILTFIEGTKQSHYIVHVIPTLVVILVTSMWILFQSGPGRRSLLVAGAVILVLLQIGSIVFRARENPYRKDWLPAIEFARPFVAQKLLVVGGPEFGMPFDFPENVVSWTDYGFMHKRVPDVVITTLSQYQRNTAVVRNNPAFYRYMTVTFFQRFQLIYRSGDIAVYRRAI